MPIKCQFGMQILGLFIFLCYIKMSSEASYFDQINMTENRLAYDLKIITPTNMNNGPWKKHYLIFLIWSYSTIHVHRCRTFSVKFHRSFSSVWSFRSCTNFSVIFIRSCWFGQMIIPLSSIYFRDIINIWKFSSKDFFCENSFNWIETSFGLNLSAI